MLQNKINLVGNFHYKKFWIRIRNWHQIILNLKQFMKLWDQIILYNREVPVRTYIFGTK